MVQRLITGVIIFLLFATMAIPRRRIRSQEEISSKRPENYYCACRACKLFDVISVIVCLYWRPISMICSCNNGMSIVK